MKHKRRIKMTVILVILLLLTVGCATYTHLPKFGGKSKGERLQRIHLSPNYSDGRFQNINHTPQITESFWNTFFQSSSKQRRPKDKIPSVKTNLAGLNPQENILVWFGHSSYYFQVDGKRFLVDPVFYHASPVSFINTAFEGAGVYTATDIPGIDYLVITHDHWDHLDYRTVKELKSRTGKVICPLGVGAHFERWHFDESKIVEMDWNEMATLSSEGFEIYCLPARHFSGRGLRQRQSLWASFLLKSTTFTIFMGGDSGYDTHFENIGKQFETIDYAILENGQYNKAWRYIHSLPEETLQTAKDLHAKNVIPVHNSKFALSRHSWNEPMQRLCDENDKQTKPLRLLTPKIGEIVFLNDTTQTFTRWWEKIE
jgi:L-ascorbate metabolism protein UlaG (beta-lactamase superfamily)